MLHAHLAGAQISLSRLLPGTPDASFGPAEGAASTSLGACPIALCSVWNLTGKFRAGR